MAPVDRRDLPCSFSEPSEEDDHQAETSMSYELNPETIDRVVNELPARNTENILQGLAHTTQAYVLPDDHQRFFENFNLASSPEILTSSTEIKPTTALSSQDKSPNELNRSKRSRFFDSKFALNIAHTRPQYFDAELK